MKLINKILIFSATITAFSLVAIIPINAYAILSYTFIWIIHNNNGYNYTYLCTGYYKRRKTFGKYQGDKYFRQVNCNPESFNIVYYYCNTNIYFTDGYGHSYYAPNPYCHYAAGVKPGAAPPAIPLPSQQPHPNPAITAAQNTVNNANNRTGLNIPLPQQIPNLPHR